MAGRAATIPRSSRRSPHLTDIAQLVYLDHRGNGRSADGDPAAWNLAQWGDDVAAFCDALGIVKPVVLGYSFGGMVAQAYATRHPGHPGRLVLFSTSPLVDREEIYAVFERLGGPAARAVAEARWQTPSPESMAGLPGGVFAAVQPPRHQGPGRHAARRCGGRRWRCISPGRIGRRRGWISAPGWRGCSARRW